VDLLEVLVNQTIIDKQELEKYLEIFSNCINDTVPLISYSLKFNNLFINQENFKLLTKLAQMTHFLFERSQMKFYECDNDKNSIFKIINFNINNSANSNFPEMFQNSNSLVLGTNFTNSISKSIDLNFLKIHIFSFIYKSICNTQKFREPTFKSFTNEIMNFLEVIILKYNVNIYICFYLSYLFYFKILHNGLMKNSSIKI